MLQAVLFDLDDTLLGNKMETFIPGYFEMLGEYAQPYLDKERFLQELLLCTRTTMMDTNTAVSNRDVFWATFQERTGLDPVELEPYFEQFYQDQFPSLKSYTECRPVAADLVRGCFEQGLKVVIATNPVFPRTAVEARLAWAGVPVTDFAYDLVTTYENMHATKPHSAYYLEILDAIDCPPQAALMVGDNWENDIIPAAALGLFTYWISQEHRAPPEAQLVAGYGSLHSLYERVSAGWLDQLASSPTGSHH